MKLLLIGADGQLGQVLQTACQSLGEIQTLTRQQVDLQDLEQLHTTVLALRPDGVINAAAYTAVDQAEKEPGLAWAINAQAPQTLAEVTHQLGIPFFHVSTDYVFDGQKNTPYLETDTPHPLGVYGQSKLAGEQAIQAVGGDYC
ncbi:MAG: SDR family oxidoreductase, partial [Microcystaceae cyanobacterium]